MPLQAQIIYEKEQRPLINLLNDDQRPAYTGYPKIGLVLSGGGARGISHVGIFKAFEKHRIPIDLIVGTSMGSIVGGFYAAGYNADQLEKIVRSIAWEDIFREETERENLFLGQKLEKDRFLINIRFDNWRAHLPTSLTSGQKVLSIISQELYDADFQMIYDFDSLKVPFRAVATDLISGKRIVIGEGDLAEAINASAAVPLLFSPVIWDGMLLVDGGLMSNLSADVAKSLGMDIIIVVDITSPLRTREELRAPWEIADQVTTIMMKNQYEHQIELADLIIKPALENVGSTDFNKIDEMITAGEVAVDSIIGDIQNLIKNKRFVPNDSTFAYTDFRIRSSADTEPEIPVGLSAGNHTHITMDRIEDDADMLISTGMFKKVSVELHDSLLVYRVDENDQYERIELSGNLLFPDSVLYQFLNQDTTFKRSDIHLTDNLKSIQNFYHERDYVLMKISEIQHNNNMLAVKIDEGRIDTIKIEGNTNTSDVIILRDFPLKKGDAYNSSLVKQGIENIYNTQLFDKVSVNIQRLHGQLILLIKVKEKIYTLMRLGGKIGTERGAQAYFELGNDNLFGISSKAALTGRYGEYDRRIGLNYRMDRIFKTYLTFAIDGYYDWKINPYYTNTVKMGEYREERSGLRLMVGQQLSKLGQMSVELRIENAKNVLYSGSFDQPQNSELRTITVRSITDKRDRIAFTTRGIYNIWYWEAGNQNILEGQEKFTKAFVNLEGYYTYWNYHTFHLRGVIGVGDKTLPFSEFFRIGGPDSFIGFHQYELIGRQVIFANLEYRLKSLLKIVSETYFGIRYDIGGIWETPDLVLTSEDFFSGAGVWLGIETVLGPLEFHYGKSTLKSGIFYLSLGYDF